MHDIPLLFAEHGLRCTKQRADVYSALASCRAHPTADELYEVVNTEAPGGTGRVSRATVYNVLEALCDAGLARRLATGAGPCRFDADLSAHCHMLTEDGRLLDVPEALSDNLLGSIPSGTLRKLSDQLGVAIDRVSITLHVDQSVSRNHS